MACLCLLLAVECGVNRGGLSRAAIHYVDFERLNNQFWLLDAYEGLVRRSIHVIHPGSLVVTL